jgi:Uri superfamily endonuclease
MPDSFQVPLTGTSLDHAITYQLHIVVSQPLDIGIGRLGRHSLAQGHYVYTGSARRNLWSRLRRHLSTKKTRHWHIDYLLSAKGVGIVGIHLSDQNECVLNQTVNGFLTVPGFGASDCRQGCCAHLKFLGLL